MQSSADTMLDQVTVSTRDYRAVSQRIAALCDGEADAIALMATISCEFFHEFEAFHWVGFYRNMGDGTLKIGPYQGGHGCLFIPFDKGVCGACARTGEVQLVDDVEAFPGHIACSSSTRSELVLPVFRDGELLGVFDIDSDNPSEFNKHDAEAISQILKSCFS